MAFKTAVLLEEVLRDRETLEALESNRGDEALLIYGDTVLVAGYYWNGPHRPAYYSAIYETIVDHRVEPESDLELIAISEEFFEDSGHAIEWAINYLNR